MTIQNYLVVEENTVSNIVSWDGNANTWQPPADATMLAQENTPTMVWSAVVVDFKIIDWELVETLGVADIGFTWDGTVLTTNQTKPKV